LSKNPLGLSFGP